MNKIIRDIHDLAEQGDAAAQNKLGQRYYYGDGVKQDKREAAGWYRLAAAQGHAAAQTNLGVMCQNGEGVKKDKYKAAELYRKAAEQGFAVAQYNLGHMYRLGQGVEADNRKAAKWYRKAAKQGHAASQDTLGSMYQNGDGLKQNSREAMKWYRKAAAQRNAVAQANLGVMYQNGDGVKKNISKALKWYHQSAGQDFPGAQYALGQIYENGDDGVEKNKCEAAEWYRKAAWQGYIEAQFALGLMYTTGKGVIENPCEAYIWFSLAAIHGDENAEIYRIWTQKRLTKSQYHSANDEAEKRRQKIAGCAYEDDTNQPQLASSESPGQIVYAKCCRSVVVIETDTGQGSGVIIRPNLVATNHHVVKNSNEITVYKANADNRLVKKGAAHRSTIIRKADNGKDLCFLDVPGLWGIAANLRSADSLRVGESVYAIGAPKGLDYSLSAGVVSRLHSENGDIQTDAAISPGSSGGGLFDGEGNLAGITTRKGMSKGAEGLSFAIPADWVLDLLNDNE